MPFSWCGQGDLHTQCIPLMPYSGIGPSQQTRSVVPPLVADEGAQCKLETTLRGQSQKCSTQHVGNQNTGIQDDDFGQSVQYRCSSIKTLRVNKGRPNNSFRRARKDARSSGSKIGRAHV